jgi:5-hydroxyisourate hydrolase-like protein (transthyretin family)
MLRIRRALLVMLLACAALCLQAGPALADTGSISGAVVDNHGGPVQSVQVTVYDTSQTFVAAAMTATDGTYTVAGLAPGPYKVGFQATSGNFAPQYYNGKSSLASADTITVVGGGTAQNIDATLTTGGKVTGTVIDSLHSGIAGVAVDVLDSNGNVLGSANTAPDGSYTVFGLGTGADKVEFFGGSYATEYYNSKPSFATANSISVTAGVTTPNINATMVVAGRIAGKVMSGSTPIAGATVIALSSPGNSVAGSTTTAIDGSYTLGGLPAGSYHVQFSAPGFVMQFYDSRSTLSAADAVAVTAGGTTPGVNATMSPAGQITGTVTDGTNSLQNVEIDLYGSGGGLVDTTCTAANGTYTLSNEPTGSYHVGFDASGKQLCGPSNYLAQYYDGKPTLALADAVTVAAGSTTSGIDATMSPAGEITGTVTDGTSPTQNVEITVYDSMGSPVGVSVCTAADGTYAIVGLATGTYHVGFNTVGDRACGGSDYLPQYFSNQTSATTATPVLVTAGSISSTVNATMQPGGHITGTVTDGTNPLRNIEVSLYTSVGSPVGSPVCTAADGTYTFVGLPTGTYNVGFNTAADAACGTSNYVAQFYGHDPVSVTAPSSTTSIDATMSVGAQISGQVTDASTGVGAPSISVELFNSGGSSPITSTSTDVNGNYTLGGLSSGSYKVEFVDGSGNYVAQYYSAKSSLGAADPIQTTSSAPAAGVNAALTTTVTHTLTVTPSGSGSGSVTSSPAGIDCGATCAAVFNNNTTVTLTETPAAGSAFAGWSGGGCSGTGTTCTVSLSADRTVTAIFDTIPIHALTVGSSAGNGSGSVTSSPAGIDCGATCSHSYFDGTVVTLSASPATGSAFAGWSGGGCSGASLTCQVTIGPDQTVTPSFTLVTHSLTIGPNPGTGSGSVTSTPSGVDCGTGCSASFDYGTAVTLTESPAPGSTFTGWSGGGCSGTSPTCQVTMSADQSVTLAFNPTPPRVLTVGTSGGSGSGTVSSSPAGISCGSVCLHPFSDGTLVTLTAVPATGSRFAGWSGGGCAGTSPTCELTMDGSQAVAATFDPVGTGGTGGSGGSGGTGGNGGGHATPAPKCTLLASRAISRKNSGTRPADSLGVTVRCDQAAAIALSGKLTIRTTSRRKTKTTTSSLGTMRASVRGGVAAIEGLKLPAAALNALRRGAGESVVLSLVATNAHGTNRTSATVSHLRRA